MSFEQNILDTAGFVGVKHDSPALPAFDLRDSKGKAGETFALPLR